MFFWNSCFFCDPTGVGNLIYGSIKMSKLVISRSLALPWNVAHTSALPSLSVSLFFCCSMSSSNWCFLTCIQVFQQAGQVVWYSHLFQNFPQFIVIHKVKGFGIVNKAEIDVFLELSCFFHDPADVGNLISSSSAFSKTSLNIRKFTVHVLLNPALLGEF